MDREHPIQGLMKTSMETLKDMVDVNTVVGVSLYRHPNKSPYWDQVSLWEEREGRPFGEIVEELRLRHRAKDLPGILGVSPHFLYTYFGDQMSLKKIMERWYGKPFEDIVLEMREQGASLSKIAKTLRSDIRTVSRIVEKNAGEGGVFPKAGPLAVAGD